jgi:hypothetical protein
MNVTGKLAMLKQRNYKYETKYKFDYSEVLSTQTLSSLLMSGIITQPRLLNSDGLYFAFEL